MILSYDIIVIGGGHAGIEAARAAAVIGSKVLLISMDMTKYGNMSCNPAIGGVAKGQIVREIDALGGMMGIITDKSTIQFRMLNLSKGPAMWSPRAQCDKQLFSDLWRHELEHTDNLYLWQDSVVKLEISGNKIVGVTTQLGVTFYSKATILTTGTFLSGLIHVGRNQSDGGRLGDKASYGISEQLKEIGFEVGRMKTGTPARIDCRSINFSLLAAQYGDTKPAKFSFLPNIKPVVEQMPCFVAYTTKEVHDTLKTGFADSPLFNGTIAGIGPRYCPSIEDKLRTFAEKESHQLFLEPEGRHTTEYYLNGFSSSLPWKIQFEALSKIIGFENIQLFRPGYAIEYDYFPPTQLKHTLETKLIDGLYFAGQVNGTTGYEEAGAQGLMAGINAHQKINKKDSFILGRDEAYIGVLIDDLVTKGVDEPYRMFTSRAEYRILLRQDNADLRLTAKAHSVGLATKGRLDIVEKKERQISILTDYIKNLSVSPQELNSYLEGLNSAPLTQKRKLQDLVLRNEVHVQDLATTLPQLNQTIEEHQISAEVVEEVEILLKYGGYIEREKAVAEKLSRLEHIYIKPEFDYMAQKSLTIEARQKLTKIKPTTIGQASRIPGVSPSDINVLLLFFGR